MVPSKIRANFDLTFKIEGAASSVPENHIPKFILGGAVSLTHPGDIDGEDIRFDFVANNLASLTTGHYWWQVIAVDTVSRPARRVFIDEGNVWCVGAIAGEGVYDGRSVAQKIVDAIDAVMLGKASRDQQSYTIQSGSGSRSLSRLNITELIEAKKFYAAIVAAEKRADGEAPLFRRHKFAFVGD